ncbi:MAG TPA: hypothetical protein VE715_11905, partial [Blastocatellia bacterium]|nr:hypothetical protein [Blastocatellia bacterium]
PSFSVNTVLLSLSHPAFSTASVLLEALEHAEKHKAISRASAGRAASRLIRECDCGGSDMEFIESEVVLNYESTEFQERHRS